MKKYIFATVMSVVLLVLQTTVMPHISPGGITPNLLVACIVIFGLIYGRRAGMYTGILTGLLYDLLYSRVIGITVIIFVLIGFFSGASNKLYFRMNKIMPAVTIALGELAFGLMMFITGFLVRGRFDLPYYFFYIILPETFYTTVLGVLLFFFVKWVDKKMYSHKEENEVKESL